MKTWSRLTKIDKPPSVFTKKFTWNLTTVYVSGFVRPDGSYIVREMLPYQVELHRQGKYACLI